MKIFLPFAVKDIGGTSSFARKFKAGMEALGHEVSYDYIPDYDILFLIVQCPLKYLLDAKKRGKKIVQRLDGTYYWSVAGWRFPLLNAKAAAIRHFFADYTIYQSQYSLVCAERFLGKKRQDHHTIIFNGVNLDVFSPEGKHLSLRDNPEQHLFFTASAFRRKDQIVPIIEGVEHYRKKYGNNCKLLIAGSFVGAVQEWPTRLNQLAYVTLLGKVTHDDLTKYERSCDAFLFTHLNPPCPNNAIEALACGLPICGVADGAMPEIVTPQKDGLLISAPGSGFWRQRNLAIDQFADNLFSIMQQKESYRKHSRQAAEGRFSLQAMIRQYCQVFERLG